VLLDYNPFLDDMPDDLRTRIKNSTWEQITIGESGAQTFLLTRPDQSRCFLKIAEYQTLQPEKERIEWLQGRLPVPQVLHFAQDETRDYLLLSEVSGLDTSQKFFEDKMPQVVRLLAQGLKMLHSLNIAGCPFDQTLVTKLEAARQNMEAGLVDEEDFDEERQARTARDLFHELLATRPTTEDLVFTHGDYCLPNIIIDPDCKAVNGFIDLGRAGIADRYQDLALAARSLAYNFGTDWTPLLFAEYGLSEPDQSKIEFYKLLDEFF
jgi:aminoglycoside phosphotransferase